MNARPFLASVLLVLHACSANEATVQTARPPAPDQLVLTAAVCEGSYEELEARVVELVNELRQEAGLAPLEPNLRLAQAAEQHSIAMAAAQRMGHLVGEGTPAQRVRESGYRFASLAENVAIAQRSAREVVEAWMGSRAHRANILGESFIETGVGVACDRWGRPYYTQVYALPRSELRDVASELRFELRNSTAATARVVLDDGDTSLELRPGAVATFTAYYLAVAPEVTVTAGGRSVSFVPEEDGDYRLIRSSSGRLIVVPAAARR